MVANAILVIGYVLIVSLLMWFIIKTEGQLILKTALIPAVIWFGLFLYYTPSQISGYATDRDFTSEKIVVRYFTYAPPEGNFEGVIYILADDRFFRTKEDKTAIDKINPKTYAGVGKGEFLRFHRLPWDEEIIKKMVKAQKKKQLIILEKTGGHGGTKKLKSQQKGRPGTPGTGKKLKADSERGGGGTTEGDDDEAKYRVRALSPNKVFPKGD